MKVREVREVYLSNGKAAYSQILSGKILVNKNVFCKLHENERIFVLLHEAGHIELETEIEQQADNYALVEYIKLGLPLNFVLSSMEKVLSNKPKNIDRKNAMKAKIDKLKQFHSVDGAPATPVKPGWGDYLNWASGLLGIGSQIAGGSESQAAIEAAEKVRLAKAEQQKKTTSYILGGLAIIAIVVLITVYSKK